MNGYGPSFALDPHVDGVSYAFVFHKLTLDPNQSLSNSASFIWRETPLRRIFLFSA
jgi:hypothetical protein